MSVYKVVSIWPNKIEAGADYRFRTIVDFGNKKFFAIKVGGTDRGEKQRFVPLVNLPVQDITVNLYDLNVFNVQIRQGRAGWIGEAVDHVERPDGTLVLLDTRGGYRGNTELPQVFGAQVVEVGWRAQGAAGRVGRHPELMILATGPARIEWVRAGRLYGGEPYWTAWTPDGIMWYCVPREHYLASIDLGIVPDAVMRLGQDENKNEQA